ncbi:phosphate-starvation-inducible protein PsiE [Cerasibacillus terrae]|uniref:Protein PsiE n=1 Tax=Cerasibacillus terrae TaxID=2498845 RepID=A0A5C8NWZ1_9BACI|nr:phosphate-starvation-inducible protein PsiE [Cerasibacillus terrae]TXL65767.1 phosphate-starvation-inducible protein PsiE [Cerasibacillus terrae]
MDQLKKHYQVFMQLLPKLLQIILNISLVFLAMILSFLLMKELLDFSQILLVDEKANYQLYLANILIFFLYFEFIAMIVKYFKEDYHFPLRYFLYIGITAMVRLIIVEHDDALKTLYYSIVILILIIGYFIMNLTPRERPESKWFFRRE